VQAKLRVLCACVVHPVKLAIRLVGRIVSDALERKRPASGYGRQPATECAPAPEVPLCAVVGDMAGLVSGSGSRAAFASGDYVMEVQVSFSDPAIAEETRRHQAVLLFVLVW
jgi:hypothetical protein